MKTGTHESKKSNKKHETQQETNKRKQQDPWTEDRLAKIKRLVQLAHAQHEHKQAERAQKYGDWAPVVDAIDDVARAMFDVAENAVADMPRHLAKVRHVREAVLARLSGDDTEPVDLLDAAYTVALLARLADEQFGGSELSTIASLLFAEVGARFWGPAITRDSLQSRL